MSNDFDFEDTVKNKNFVVHQEEKEKTLLISIGSGKLPDEAVKEELKLLAESAGAQVLDILAFNRPVPDAKYFLGKGQAEEIAEKVSEYKCDLAIFDAALSPSQERNLEKLLQCRVLDRSGLVLDIFAARAKSREGKLQVELAQLTHLSTRLVRGWTHLERQKGGIGLRGPGETQLETDRRLLGERIKQLKKRLEKVEFQRAELRKNRNKREFLTVALAGYTNAGKSTLFNILTNSQVLARDQLFATLDPTYRKLADGKNPEILLVDTVGFVSGLPHELVAAFRSTLEETIFADLILHIIDRSAKDIDEIFSREAVVDKVLAEIGAEKIPQIRVYNKIDLTGEKAEVINSADGKKVFISAKSGLGIDALIAAIREHFSDLQYRGEVLLKPSDGEVRAIFYREQAVVEETVENNGEIRLQIDIPKSKFNKIASKFELTANPPVEK